MTFPLFLQLPSELQDLVWKSAIPPVEPTAYCAQMVQQHGHDADKYWVISVGQPNESIPALSCLLTACRRSSAVAISAYNAHAPKQPFELPGLRHPIDAEADLLVFQVGWQPYCVRFDPNETPRRLGYVGVEWPGEDSSHSDEDFGEGAFNGLDGLLSVWAPAHAFYVVVHPGYLRTAERQWNRVPGAGFSGFTRPGETLLASYQRYSKDDAGSEGLRFRSGPREYYEVPPAQVAQSGGLEHVVELLDLALALMVSRAEFTPPRCKIMSWKQTT
jgi:hypothetical protein